MVQCHDGLAHDAGDATRHHSVLQSVAAVTQCDSSLRSPSLPRPIGLTAHNGPRFLIVCRYIQDQRRTKLTTRMCAAPQHGTIKLFIKVITG
jgi:hypothetical protein